VNSPVDVPAFLLAVAMSAIVTAVLVWANRGENRRRLWIVAGALAVVLGAIAVLSRVWLRGIVAFVATFVLLFAGLLIGATVLPRYLP
jgi:ABC-type iron transport system FetAB permease component